MTDSDVCDTNLLVRTDDECGFVLIDFDWAGKEGEARYPINVNRTGIKRPDGAEDRQLTLTCQKYLDTSIFSIYF